MNRKELVESYRLCPHVPVYHFISPEPVNWPMDPNGVIFWHGKYHLFYLYQNDNKHSCWGHASSRDLVTWEYHVPALLPDEEKGELQIYSGCALLDLSGKPVIVYYGYQTGICLAYPLDDDLLKWEKYCNNPVLKDPRNRQDDANLVYSVFDPHVWIEDNGYKMILGAYQRPYMEYDTCYLFSSPDLIHWQYERPFYQPNKEWTMPTEDMACPDFFKLGDRYLLMGLSHYAGARYYLGKYLHGTFIPEEHHRLMGPGGCIVSPESCLDNQNRRLVWFWLRGQTLGEDGLNAPHAGYDALSLPRIFSCNSLGQLEMDVPVELQQLRQSSLSFKPFELHVGTTFEDPRLSGNVVELEMECDYFTGCLVIEVGVAKNRKEYSKILFDMPNSALIFDATNSSCTKKVGWSYPVAVSDRPDSYPTQTLPFKLQKQENLSLKVFIDHSIVEIFANRRQVLCQRIYPLPDSNGIALKASGSNIKFNHLIIHQMSSLK